LEFKVGYVAKRKDTMSYFDMNTWIFIPDSLDINAKTYLKSNFYRDVRSYVRLITPTYLLRDLTKEENLPFSLLRQACATTTSQYTNTNLKENETQIKMFASIVKSSIRNGYLHIINNAIDADRGFLCNDFIEHIKSIIGLYRSLRKIVNVPCPDNRLLEYFNFGDEFIANVVEQHVTRLLDYLNSRFPGEHQDIKKNICDLLDKELEYKQTMHYIWIRQHDEKDNQDFVYHAGLLKKYIESNLYLNAHKRRNTLLLEQAAFSIAAGIAMIFATSISFAFQQTYGNFTLPFFIALVISYMFKDRIKDLIKYYFANKLGSRFFDNVISIRVDNKKLGWCKEGFDYITFSKVFPYILDKRGRTSLLEVNRGIEEQVILYRKRVRLKREKLITTSRYPILGINDIIRYNLSEFMRKMDNQNVVLYSTDEKEYNKIKAKKVYYLNYVIQCIYQGQTEYKRYRIGLTRKEIRSIEEIQ
jgi:hypothetical protein